jgi:adenylate cyclase
MAAIAVAATLAAAFVAQTTPVRIVEAAAGDLRVAFLAPPATARIVIAAIDEATVQAWRETQGACACRAPIDERHIAGLLQTLDAMGASVIGVDLLADEKPDPAARAVLIDTLNRIQAKVVLLADGDPALRAAAPAKIAWARANLGVIDEFDAVLRRHDPAPGPERSFDAALAAAGGGVPPDERFLVRFRAPRAAARAFDVYPASAIALMPREWISGAIVLVGRMETDPGAPPLVEDLHLTPLRLRRVYAAGLYGVEGHAHVLDQMLAGDRVRTPSLWGAAALLLVFAGAGVFAGRRPGRWAAALGFVFAAALALGAGAVVLYAGAATLIPVASPLLAFGIAFLIANRALSGDLERERRFLRDAFSRYLAPQVIDGLVLRPESVRLDAESRTITVIATDLQGFSALVAGLPPERLAALMNAYFDALISELWRHGAMIDKLVGDGLVAIFGAPEPTLDHAARAVACVRSLDAAAEAFRAAAPARFGVTLGVTRIGLETGPALVGNFGGALRFDYTAYGEVMVRAARLQAANKVVGGRVLIGPEAQSASGARLTSAGKVALPGLNAPIELFRLESQSDQD